MVANLILEAAGTAGMLAGEVTRKPDTVDQEKKRTLLQAAIQGPKTTLNLLNSILGKAGMLGLNLSVSSALRQGQTWTTMVSTLFQLAGAFLDQAFAPFIPAIAQGLKWFAGHLPAYGDFMQGVGEQVQTAIDKYRKDFPGVVDFGRKLMSVAMKMTANFLMGLEKALGAWLGRQSNANKAVLWPFIWFMQDMLYGAAKALQFSGEIVRPDQPAWASWLTKWVLKPALGATWELIKAPFGIAKAVIGSVLKVNAFLNQALPDSSTVNQFALDQIATKQQQDFFHMLYTDGLNRAKNTGVTASDVKIPSAIPLVY